MQAYRPERIAKAPTTFQEVVEAEQSLIFPAAGDQQLFTLALYSAGGGALTDEQGRPLSKLDSN